MTNFKKLSTLSIDDLSNWLDKHGQFDGSPWMDWFSKEYCDRCPPIMCHYEGGGTTEFPCAWCEANGDKCKFFPNTESSLDNIDIIKMWLNLECDEDE